MRDSPGEVRPATQQGSAIFFGLFCFVVVIHGRFCFWVVFFQHGRANLLIFSLFDCFLFLMIFFPECFPSGFNEGCPNSVRIQWLHVNVKVYLILGEFMNCACRLQLTLNLVQFTITVGLFI